MSIKIFFVVLLYFVLCIKNVNGIRCYGTSMQPKECAPIDLWCIKYINGSDITRDCANVYDYCIDEDAGCYPATENNGVQQKWCCCKHDLCNSSVSTFFGITIIFFITNVLLN